MKLLEYANTSCRKEDFEEYLRCFTGYCVSTDRDDSECAYIYKCFEKKYDETMSYDDFVEIYFWEFVRQRQDSQITYEEFTLNEKLLKEDLNKIASDLEPRTFKEWKYYFFRQKDRYLRGVRCLSYELADRFKDVNLNDYIKVKLNEEGYKIFSDYYEGHPYELKEDNEGYVLFQLWEFMRIFGQHFFMGLDVPCDLNVKIQIKKE